MTKKDIVIKIADEKDIKQIHVKEVMQAALDVIIDSLAKGETVELRNFGIFKVKFRKPRIGRNPKTGETVEIPAKKTATFKSGLVMKERVK